MSYFSKIDYQDSGHLDGFDRLRVSMPRLLYQSEQQYDIEPLLQEAGITGTGITPTHSTSTRMTTVSVGAGTGTSFLQGYDYTPYQPGRSQLIQITGTFGTAVANAVADFGYFDDANGIFYRQNGTSGLQFVRRTSTSGSVVDTAVNQADWNIDKFDGTGPSGVTLDATKGFVLSFDLQYLGMGRVRCGFFVGTALFIAHEFRNANSLTVPYMQTAALPVQVLMTGTAIGGTASCTFKCSAIASEGGEPDNLGYSFSTPEGTVTAGATRTHILSLRPKTTFNGLTNRERLDLNNLNLLAGNNDILWELCFGVTFSAAPTFADVNTSFSAFEYGTAGTYSSLASGFVVASGYVASTNANKGDISTNPAFAQAVSLNRAGAVRALGTMSLLLTSITGTSACRATFNFHEHR